jgi:cytochrome c2
VEENSVGYSIITTVAGVLLATALVVILGASIFMWADTSATRAAAPAVEAQPAAPADAATEAESGTAAEVTAETASDGEAAAANANEAMAEPVAAAPDDVSAAFMKGTCIGCHVVPGVPNANGMVGPDLSNIATVAATRVEGQSAEEYLHESIINPEAYIAPDCPTGPCPSGIMLPTFGQLLSEDELNGVVDYLLTLNGG